MIKVIVTKKQKKIKKITKKQQKNKKKQKKTKKNKKKTKKFFIEKKIEIIMIKIK